MADAESPRPAPQLNTPSGLRGKPRLLDRLRHTIRARHYSRRTEKAYVGWVRRFIFFHDKRHPDDMGEEEVTAFLNYLAVELKVSAFTQNQARNAILFLYKNVLDRDLEWLDEVVYAKGPRRLPVVLTKAEVVDLLRNIEGTPRLVASLMYGSGTRLLECCRLRVKDIDFEAAPDHRPRWKRSEGPRHRSTDGKIARGPGVPRLPELREERLGSRQDFALQNSRCNGRAAIGYSYCLAHRQAPLAAEL